MYSTVDMAVVAFSFTSILIICSDVSSTNEVEVEFQHFMKEYNKTYNSNEEYEKRLYIFATNLKLQYKLNQHRNLSVDVQTTAWYGVNKFSDLSPEEFKDRYLSGFKHDTMPVYPVLRRYVMGSSQPVGSTRPDKLDWRKNGIITKARDQQHCGGCWAFSSVEAVESMLAMKRGKLVPLSVQQTIDCSFGFQRTLYGCGGGETCAAFRWMLKNKVRIAREKDYPLRNEDQFCMLPSGGSTDGAIVSNFSCVSYNGSEEVLLDQLSRGPVSASVDASNWANYQGGIIQFHCGEVPPNHAVLIVGYDLTGPIPYYIVKNSWGTNFGHDGYVYVKFGENVCRIAGRVSSVEVI